MTVRVTVVGQYDGRSLAAAQRDLDKLKRAQLANSGPMGKMAAGLKNQLTPNFMAMGAAVAAAGAALAAFAIKLGVDAVQAAAAEEQAVAKLTTALENVGQGFRVGEVETFIDNLQRVSGVADDELRPALQTLVTATGDVTQSQDLLTLALDVSAASGKDLTSVSAALAKAANGQFTQINRLTNGALNPSILATKDLSLITEELTRLFGGQAEASAQTFAGSIERLKIAAGELLEAFGEGFIEAFSSSTDEVTGMADAMRKAEPSMEQMGQVIGDLVVLATEFGPLIDLMTQYVTNFIKAQVAMTGLPILNWFIETFGGGKGAVDSAAESAEALGVKFSGPMSAGAQNAYARMRDLASGIEETDDALSDLNDEMAEFFGFLDDREAVRNYESAVDDLRASLKENKKTFDTNTEAGRANEDALDGVFNSALKVAEGQATAAEKITTMKDAARDAKTQLDKTNLSEEAKQRLLQPFDDAIYKFQTATTNVDNLKAAMERLPRTIPIDITVETTYIGTPPPGGYPTGGSTRGSAYGGFVGGHGGTRADDVPAMLSSGEFVIQAPSVSKFGRGFFAALNQGVNPLAGMTPSVGGSGSGLTINGGITVTAAPGEAAAVSLPRALRRAAFLAGMNG